MTEPLNKNRIAQCFRQAIATYDRHATVQRQVGARLLSLVGQFSAIKYDKVLEIGCCTGLLTQMLCQQQRVQTLFLNDMVVEFEAPVMAKISAERMPQVQPCFGDIETLQLPERLSLVLSSATFQWLTDLPGFLHRLFQSLEADGFLAFSIFVPGTLREFTELTGVGIDYQSSEEIAGLLERDFILERMVTEENQLILPTPRDVLYHLRATGVGGVRPYRWSSIGLRRFEKEYWTRFEVDGAVPVTYVSACYIARKK